MQFKSVAIGSDHAGYELKESVKKFLHEKNIEIKDFGTYSSESVDYPEFAVKVAESVHEKKFEVGIVICGSGIGVSISANKIPGIRAALCANDELAKLSRLHNNANILAMGARFITPQNALKTVAVFLSTEFEGGRHERRVEKIHNLTNC